MFPRGFGQAGGSGAALLQATPLEHADDSDEVDLFGRVEEGKCIVPVRCACACVCVCGLSLACRLWRRDGDSSSCAVIIVKRAFFFFLSSLSPFLLPLEYTTDAFRARWSLGSLFDSLCTTVRVVVLIEAMERGYVVVMLVPGGGTGEGGWGCAIERQQRGVEETTTLAGRVL